MLQCVAVCDSGSRVAFQSVAVCCSVLQCVTVGQEWDNALQVPALQCFAVGCSVLQCLAVCYSVLQCVSGTPLGTPPCTGCLFCHVFSMNRSLYMYTYGPSRQTLP